jgi:hypothetical protein
MLQKQSPKKWIPWIASFVLISGCDDRVTQVAIDGANRQAQQNTAMAELNRNVADGTRGLVMADAQARKEIIAVHLKLQEERIRLDTGWNALQQEKREIAGERRTESMLVAVTKAVGGLALVFLLLGFSWYAVAAARSGDDTDARLNELLICEILSEDSPLISTNLHLPNLLDQSSPQDRPDE